MKNWRATTLAEYQNSEKLISLLESINDWIDPSTNFETFFNVLWNLDTAVGYGLDVWGRILVIPRRLTITVGSFFGFQEAGDRTGFNQESFGDLYAGWDVMTISYIFTFPLEPFEKAIVQSGVLPKPTGVRASWLYF